jgi:DNA-binding transcriptional regulator LsrR (DeoR family)
MKTTKVSPIRFLNFTYKCNYFLILCILFATSVHASVPSVPGVPGTGGSAYVPVNKNYTLSWSAASGTVSRYELLENGGTVYSGSSRSTTRKHSSYGRRLYKVRACNASGCSAYSSQNPVVLYTAPGPAANFAVSASSVAQGGSVTLTWGAAGGSVYGAVYHVTTISPSGGSSTTQTTGLTMRKTLSLAGGYSFKIVTCNPQNVGCGSSRNASVTSIPPAPGVPGAPGTGGSAYVPVNKNYTLSWSAASGTVSRYELLEDGVKVYSGSSRSKIRKHSSYGRRLYKVRACNVSGCSAYSPQNPVVLYTAPGPAANFAVSASSVAQGQSVKLSWKAAGGSVPGAVYHITTTLPSGGSSTSQTTGLSMNKTLSLAGGYSFKIVTCNPQNVGCGSSRNVSATSIPPAPGVPGVPGTGGSAYVPVNTNYTLSWSAASGTVSRYELLEDGVKVYSGTSRSKIRKHSSYGRRLYKVRACNVSGCSAYSPQNPVVLYTAPGPAANFAVSASSIVQGESMTLNWDAAGGSVFGAVYHVTTTPPSGSVTVSQTTGLTMTQTLSLAGEYTFKIVACNPQNVGCGSSKNISVTAVAPTPGIPGQPGTGGSAYVPVNTNYTLSWSAASGTVTHYELLENDVDVYSGEVLETSLNYSDYGKKLYKVRACNGLSCGEYSALRSIVLYTAPGPAANFTVSATSVEQGKSVTLNWEAAGGSVPGAVYHVTTTLPSGGSSIFQTAGLAMNKTLSLVGEYSFKIVVCNPQDAGCGSSKDLVVTAVLSNVAWQADNVFVGQAVSITGLDSTVNYCVANGDTAIQFNYDSSASTTTFYSASDIAFQSWQCFDGQDALVQEFEAALTIKKLAAPLNLIGQ